MSLGQALAAMARAGQRTPVAATVVRWTDEDTLNRARFTDPASQLHRAQPHRRDRASPAHSQFSLRYFVRSDQEVGVRVVSSASPLMQWSGGRRRVPVELRPMSVLERLRLRYLHDHDVGGRPVARLVGTPRLGRSAGHNPPWSDGDETLLDVDMDSGYLCHTDVRWHGTSVITTDLVNIVPGDGGPDEAFARPTTPRAQVEPAVALDDWFAARSRAPFALFAPRRIPAGADVHLVWWPARSEAAATFKDGALETRVVQPFGERFVRITQGRSRLAPPEPELWDVVGDAARQVHRWTQPSERGRRAVHVLIVDLGDTEAEVVSNLDNEDALAIAASLQVFP